MPKLDYETRTRLLTQEALYRAVDERVKRLQQYTSYHCRLCNWASNGTTLDEAFEANRLHEDTHPERDEWDKLRLNIRDIPMLLHDHDCDMQLCACRCGCSKGPFCTLVFGPLCSYCMTRDGRGDDEHGVRQEA